MDYSKLQLALDEQYEKARAEKSHNTARELDEAINVLLDWLDAGSPEPVPDVVEQYAYLLNEQETAVASEDPPTELEDIIPDNVQEPTALAELTEDKTSIEDAADEVLTQTDTADNTSKPESPPERESEVPTKPLVDEVETAVDTPDPESKATTIAFADDAETAVGKPELESQSETEDEVPTKPPVEEGETAVVDFDPGQDTHDRQEQERNLSQARNALKRGLAGDMPALTTAIQIAGTLREVADPDIANEAKAIYARANDARNQLIEDALEAGDQARAEGDLETARNHYQRARQIDGQNDQTRLALEQLDIATVKQISQQEIENLRAGLRTRRDVSQLGEAVYRAEAWHAEGRLPAELVELLADARPRLDEQRTAQGQMTTLVHFGDLRARKEARDLIETQLSEGQRTIFDATTNQMRPSHQVLEVANKSYEEISARTAQREVERIRRDQIRYPRYALQRLNRALQTQIVKDSKTGQPKEEPVLPFFDQHRDKLEALQSEIEAAVEDQEAAEGLIQEAEKATTFLERLTLLLKAQMRFPNISGLTQQITTARSQAIQDLDAQMVAHLNDADLALAKEDFSTAHIFVKNARDITLQWQQAELEIPSELIKRREEAEAKDEEIFANRQLWDEFEAYNARIRELVKNPDTRKQGINRFDNKVRDREYSKFKAYEELESHLEQYRDVSENLFDAKLEASKNNWPKVLILCEKMIKKASGDLKIEIEALYKKANFENQILRLKDHLRQKNILGADEILSQLKEDPLYNQETSERLQDEEQRILHAKAQSKPLEGLFNIAEGLSKPTNKVSDRMQALLMFRFIAGHLRTKPKPEWPDYQLSIVTASAADQIVELREDLRTTLLPGILATAASINKGQNVPGDELSIRAADARSLRDGQMLDNEEEREAVRKLLLELGRREAKEKEKLGNWDEAVSVWEDLDFHYPRTVHENLLNARLQQIVTQVDQHLHQENPDEALKRLNDARKDGDLAQNPALDLKRAEAQLSRLKKAEEQDSLNDFSPVFKALDMALKHGADQEAVSEKRTYFERECLISIAVSKANHERKHNPKEALLILNNAIHGKETANSTRLKRLRMDIFREHRDKTITLVNKLKSSGSSGSTKKQDIITSEGSDTIRNSEWEKGVSVEDKIDAVVALVELRELETLAEIEKGMMRAENELLPLREELEPGATQVIEKAEKYSPRHGIEDALRQAVDLSIQLETFGRVMPLFVEELAGVKDDLSHSKEEIDRNVSKLHKLKELLEEVKNVAIWIEALKRDNFEPLLRKQRQMEELRLDEISEVHDFSEKLAQWQDIYFYLRDVVRRIKQNFTREYEKDEQTGQVNDLFRTITSEIHNLKVRPDTIYINVPHAPLRQQMRSLQRINDDDYQLIYRLIGNKLTIITFDRQRLTGWEEVASGAEERAHEIALWHAWMNHITPALDDLQESIKKQRTQGDAAKPFNVQRGYWFDIAVKAQKVLDLLETPPQEFGEPMPVRSMRASKIQSGAKSQANHARKFLTQAELFLSQPVPIFPTAQDFVRVARSAVQLRLKVEEAQEIGPTPIQIDPELYEKEKKRLEAYEKRLIELENPLPKNLSFWQRLFGGKDN